MFRHLSRSVVAFLKDDSGPTAVEYAVNIALVAVVLIHAVQVLGSNANSTFSKVGTTIQSTSS
jgi:pilus assembly protein Flp/PilA